MRECMQSVAYLLRAKIQCIWIDTYEEQAVIADLKEVLSDNFPGMSLSSWSMATGLKKHAMTEYEKQDPPNEKISSPQAIFAMIQRAQEAEDGEQTAFALLDYHAFSNTDVAKRGLRDIKEYPPYTNYAPIIVVSPVQNIAVEHEKLFTLVSYDLPGRSELELETRDMAEYIDRMIEAGKQVAAPSEEDQRRLVNACYGLTRNEVQNAFAKSLVQYRELSLQAILDEKIQLVKKSGVLDYMQAEFTLNDMGGNKAFKAWLSEVKDSFSDEAIEFGVKPSKGYMAYGIAGTSKSCSAQVVAAEMGWPLLSLNLARIMDKHVGASEQKITQALRVVKACAPCVLLIDECEKQLGGISSSNGSDSGTLARVFSTVLNFLNEDTNVFVVMTSNDVSQLPPELTRSGRLDMQWYFSLPTKEERQEIFKIHFGKTGKEISDLLILSAAKASEHYTGAEIKDAVKFSLRKAYARSKIDAIKEVTEQDILAAIKDVIPLYKSSREKISALEAYAKGRAKNSHEDGKSSMTQSSDAMLMREIQLK